jgi:hypothetical protein
MKLMGYIILTSVVVVPTLILYGIVIKAKNANQFYAENEEPLGIGA